MPDLLLQNIFIYPIKSLSGIELSECELDERGLKNDRRFMLVDENKRFITQREFPQLALLRTAIDGNEIVVTNHRNQKLNVPLEIANGDLQKARIWNDECDVIQVGQEADDFFSEAIAGKCSLVFMPDTSHRAVNPKYALQQSITAFTDGYPILLIGTASLDDLNSRLEVPIEMNRFRPAIVVKTTEAFDEDYWADFRIGDLQFHGVKLCSRCVITTIDQQTGEAGKEPLRTLNDYRKMNHNVYFGQNVVANSSTGKLKVNDQVVISRKAEPSI